MIFFFKDHMVEYVSFERDSAYCNTVRLFLINFFKSARPTCIYTELTLEITITYLCHIISVLLEFHFSVVPVFVFHYFFISHFYRSVNVVCS